MLVHEESEDAFCSEAWVNVVKWKEHFTESAILFHYVDVVFIKLESPL
jgi:hypothetical protein